MWWCVVGVIKFEVSDIDSHCIERSLECTSWLTLLTVWWHKSIARSTNNYSGWFNWTIGWSWWKLNWTYWTNENQNNRLDFQLNSKMQFAHWQKLSNHKWIMFYCLIKTGLGPFTIVKLDSCLRISYLNCSCFLHTHSFCVVNAHTFRITFVVVVVDSLPLYLLRV